MITDKERDRALASLLLRNMPEALTDKLLASASMRRFDRGETIFLQGDRAKVVHVVTEGWVKLYRVAPNGNEAVVSVMTQGNSFGEAVAFRNDTYPVSAEAVTDCKMVMISTGSLLALMREEPELCLAVLSSTFRHLHEMVEQLEQIKSQTGAQRVAEFILDLCPVEEGSCVVTLPYDKVLIAGRLGMKPESLSRAFSKLRPLGLRIARNHASIDDVAKLRDYSEIDPATAWNKAL